MRTICAALLAGVLGFGAFGASAEDALTRTVAALHQDKSALAGKSVRVQGKVVKVNNGIMGRNFLHLQDGTGDASSNDLTVTSKQTAAVGDQVTITGKVVLDRDFGSGYLYPLLVEEASIAPAK
jgi:starvation-inducible outer membrane lipoprotein